MADPSYLDLLKQGKEAWNSWRTQHLRVSPDLKEAKLSSWHLDRFDLSGAILMQADLHEADLQEAQCIATNLQEANLRGTNLAGTVLVAARLQEADLTAANLRGGYSQTRQFTGSLFKEG